MIGKSKNSIIALIILALSMLVFLIYAIKMYKFDLITMTTGFNTSDKIMLCLSGGGMILTSLYIAIENIKKINKKSKKDNS